MIALDAQHRGRVLGLVMPRLSVSEGFSAVPYVCSTGHCTIGKGCNLEAHRDRLSASMREATAGLTGAAMRDKLLTMGLRWSRREAEAVMCAQADAALDAVLDRWPWAAMLDDARLSVLVDMCYNMGLKRLETFKMFRLHLQAGDYSQAADEMLNSRWARQVKGRADVLAKIMREGYDDDAA